MLGFHLLDYVSVHLGPLTENGWIAVLSLEGHFVLTS